MNSGGITTRGVGPTGLDRRPQGGAIRHPGHDVEVAAVPEHLDQASALGRARLVEHDGRQVSHLGLDRVPEQDELDGRNAEHHAERHPVPTKLHQLLPQHGPERRLGDTAKPRHTTAPSSRRCSSMNTSSMVGWRNCSSTSGTVPMAMSRPRERNASRPHCAASSM